MPEYTQEHIAERLATSEIGGGAGLYDRPADAFDPDDADVIVSAESELRDECAEPGATVFIESDATLFLDDYLTLAEGVTIASGRSKTSRGAQLITNQRGSDSPASNGIIRSEEDGILITGLRIRGPKATGGFQDWPISEYIATGIHLHGDSRIHNCEVYGFPHASIRIGRRRSAPTVRVDNCHLHSNYQKGLGYNIDVLNGYAEIYSNWLDDARHHIVGFGFDSCEYDVMNNVLGPRALLHSVDMHCPGENFPDGSPHVTEDPDADGNPWYAYRAGGDLKIRQNTFAYRTYVDDRPGVAIAIRGEPAEQCLITRNRLMHEQAPETHRGEPGQAWRQINVDWTPTETGPNGWTENFIAEDNQFGAPATPYSRRYGAAVDLTSAEPSEAMKRKQAAAIAQSLRDIHEPVGELHRALTTN